MCASQEKGWLEKSQDERESQTELEECKSKRKIGESQRGIGMYSIAWTASSEVKDAEV